MSYKVPQYAEALQDRLEMQDKRIKELEKENKHLVKGLDRAQTETHIHKQAHDRVEAELKRVLEDQRVEMMDKGEG